MQAHLDQVVPRPPPQGSPKGLHAEPRRRDHHHGVRDIRAGVRKVDQELRIVFEAQRAAVEEDEAVGQTSLDGPRIHLGADGHLGERPPIRDEIDMPWVQVKS